ncbi:MAG: tetratricopeptide repeat protein [Bacteroidota bacterium]
MGQKISIQEATNKLKLTINFEKERNHLSQFFFVVGSGISFPSIPLASGIEKELKEKLKNQGIDFSSESEIPMKRYSDLFCAAIPDPSQRQQFLKEKIKGKPISYANFLLAHILTSRMLGNLVVTPNFDDHLFRALTTFGEHPIVSDHPLTSSRIDPQENQEIQILHVHGSYQFYDCCNLDYEMENRTKSEMMLFVSTLMSHRSPIIIGYSGWENDIIMSSIKNRINAGSFRSTAYWFCYKSSDYDALPNWLKEASNINFVVPLQNENSSTYTAIFQLKKGIPADKLIIEDNIEPFIGKISDLKVNGEPVEIEKLKDFLTTSDLNALPLQLQKKSNPHYFAHMRQFEYEATTVLTDLISSLEIPIPQIFANPVEHLLQLIETSTPTIEKFDPRDIYKFDTTIKRLRRIRDLVINIEMEPAELLLEKVSEASQQANFPQTIINIHEIVNNETISSSLSREDWESILGPLIVAISKTDGIVNIQLAGCLLFLNIAQKLQSKHFSVNADLIISHLMKTAELYMKMENYDEALKAYEALFNNYNLTNDSEWLPITIVNKGILYHKKQHYEKAAEFFNDYILKQNTFNKKVDIEKGLIFCHYHLGLIEFQIENHKAALEMFESVVEKLSNRNEPELLDLNLDSILKIMIILQREEKVTTALVWADKLSTIIKENHTTLDPTLSQSINTFAYFLILKAKKLSKNKFKVLLNRAVNLLDIALTISVHPMYLGNKAYAKFLLGNKVEAKTLFTKALSLKDSGTLLEETIKDTEIDTIEADREFKELIIKISSTKNSD